MASSYPGALDALTNPVAGDMQNSPSHSGQHTNSNDAIEAIEAELGTDPSGASATVKARLTAMDAVDALRVVGSNATTAPSSPVVGQVWVDHSTPATPVIKVWSGSAWVNPSSAGSGGAALVWATVTGGTVTEYTKPDGSVMEVHTFTASGSSLTVVQAGYADVLVVGAGGSGGSNGRGGGGGGEVLPLGLRPLAVGTLAATIGTSVAANGQTPAGSTTFGAVTARGGTAGDDPAGGWKYQTGDNASGTGAEAGITSAISGTAVVYGAGGATQNLVGPANTGQGGGWTAAGGANPIGGSGVVIVAVQKTPPTASGVVATGGTETTFTGDGTNGVLGQGYKVHTFLTSSSLVVSAAPAGSVVDVLLCGGGGGGGSGQASAGGGGGGGGGGVQRILFDLPTGSTAVVVGAGGAGGATGAQQPGTDGGYSAFGAAQVAGGGGGGRGSTANTHYLGAGRGGGCGGGGGIDCPGGSGAEGQGFDGAAIQSPQGGGGGGAGAVGSGTAGGAGKSDSITGTATTYSGGGQGGVNAVDPATPTGYGKGGGGVYAAGGTAKAGTAGIVIVRYKV